MEHSINFEKVKNYYKNNFWDEKRVKSAVAHNWITIFEFKEITGKDYLETIS